MIEPIRVLIADDHPIVRCGLRAMIAEQPDMAVAGEASDGVEVLWKVRTTKPNVILLDMEMPRLDSLIAIRQIKQEQPEVQILLLTTMPDDVSILSIIKSGAQGCLNKDASLEQLSQGIRAVFQGKCPLDPSTAARLIGSMNYSKPLPTTEDLLSEREISVIKLVAQGLSNQEIAQVLIVSERTVGNHIGAILSKLRLSNRTQAALYALKCGFATLTQPSVSPQMVY